MKLKTGIHYHRSLNLTFITDIKFYNIGDDEVCYCPVRKVLAILHVFIKNSVHSFVLNLQIYNMI